MLVTEYVPGDELEVCGAAARESKETGREALTPALWMWRHVRNPLARAPWAVVARSEGRVLAHAAAVPSLLRIGPSCCAAAQVFFGGLERKEGFRQLHEVLFHRLEREGVEIAYVLADELGLSRYQELGLEPLFQVHARNMYLGLSGVSSRLDRQALRPFRRIAREARRIRPKLIEVPPDESTLVQAARLFIAQRESEGPAIALEKGEAFLKWRYLERPGPPFRVLVLRRKAGAGIDAFVILRTEEIEPGRLQIQLFDHATRSGGRRAMARLLGEIALWGLAEKADVLQGFAANGSELDQALVGAGCIRKKRERVFAARVLGRSEGPLSSPFPSKHVDLHAGDVEL